MTNDDKILCAKFNEAIRRLKAQGIIKYDKDMAHDLHYKQPTISQYKDGTYPLSHEFLSRFKKFYKIDIAKITLPIKGKEPLIHDTDTKLLILIANKLGIPKSEILKTLK